MFNIVAYSHDGVTDALTIKVFVQLKPNGKIIDDGGHFKTKASGDAWLHDLKKFYLNEKIQNFLLHKKFIIESGIGHKSLGPKKIALDHLYRFLEYSCTKAGLVEACKWCIREKENFERVLPSPNNPSYDSSVDALSEIMIFAKSHAPKETTV